MVVFIMIKTLLLLLQRVQSTVKVKHVANILK